VSTLCNISEIRHTEYSMVFETACDLDLFRKECMLIMIFIANTHTTLDVLLTITYYLHVDLASSPVYHVR